MASDWQDDEPPFVGPEIQNRYEAELGRFLVAFNQIENCLGTLIIEILHKNEKGALGKTLANSHYALKVNYLEVLSTTAFGKLVVGCLPFSELRSLGTKRNNVAHGHFVQDPFSGEFEIGGKIISIELIGKYGESARQIWETLRLSQAHLDFQDIVFVASPEDG